MTTRTHLAAGLCPVTAFAFHRRTLVHCCVRRPCGNRIRVFWLDLFSAYSSIPVVDLCALAEVCRLCPTTDKPPWYPKKAHCSSKAIVGLTKNRWMIDNCHSYGWDYVADGCVIVFAAFRSTSALFAACTWCSTRWKSTGRSSWRTSWRSCWKLWHKHDNCDRARMDYLITRYGEHHRMGHSRRWKTIQPRLLSLCFQLQDIQDLLAQLCQSLSCLLLFSLQ